MIAPTHVAVAPDSAAVYPGRRIIAWAQRVRSRTRFFDTEERRHGAHGEKFFIPNDEVSESIERCRSRINTLSVTSVLRVSVSKIRRTKKCAAGKP
jgi:hypothetical protein